MPATWKFTFICGQDDYLVGRVGRERFDGMAEATADEFSREIISGYAANIDEVSAALNRFREAVQTLPTAAGAPQAVAGDRRGPGPQRQHGLPASDGRPKIELADLATAEVVNMLGPTDQFGCIAVERRPARHRAASPT